MKDRDERASGRNAWEDFFDAHAPHYMENVFVRATEEEIEFLVSELRLRSGDSILDAGCGTGRHSIALAQMGYRVTGVDLSEGMLAIARAAAREAGVEVNFVKADISRMNLDESFDAAVCLCEGGFGLLPSREVGRDHDLDILRNISHVLKLGGRFVITALNGMRFIRMFGPEEIASGKFDPNTLTERSVMSIEGDPTGKEITVYERGFVPSELKLMLQLCGFKVENIWGGTAGNWEERVPDPDEMEIMAVAERKLDL